MEKAIYQHCFIGYNFRTRTVRNGMNCKTLTFMTQIKIKPSTKA